MIRRGKTMTELTEARAPNKRAQHNRVSESETQTQRLHGKTTIFKPQIGNYKKNEEKNCYVLIWVLAAKPFRMKEVNAPNKQKQSSL